MAIEAEELNNDSQAGFKGAESYAQLGHERTLGPVPETQSSPQERVAGLISHLPTEHGELAKALKLSPEEVQVAIDNAEAMRPAARVAIRMSRSVFDTFLSEGQLKNYRETGHSSGKGDEVQLHGPSRDEYDKYRTLTERRMGLINDGDEKGPIYGYLESTSTLAERTMAGTYGSVSLVLKPEVEDRSTFAVGDSANQAGNVRLYGASDAVLISEARDISMQRTGGRTGGYVRGNPGAAQYLEAQIQGGVTSRDVEQVVMAYGQKDKRTGEPEVEFEDFANDMESKLEEVHRTLPGVKVTIRLSVEHGFPLKPILALAKDNPNDDFVGFYDERSPFRAGRAVDELGDHMQYNFEKAQKDHEQATGRLAELRAKTVQRWQELGGEGEPPPNLRFTTYDRTY